MGILYDLVTVNGECPDKMSLSFGMGRLQGVAIRKPGDLPAVCTGQSDAQCREESAVRVSWGILPRFYDAGGMPLFAVRF